MRNFIFAISLGLFIVPLSAPSSPAIKANTQSIQGKWSSNCRPTTNDDLGIRSLSWSLEFNGNEITYSEYNFKDAHCQELVGLDVDLGSVEYHQQEDGVDATFASYDYDKAVVASYFQSTDRVFFVIRNTSAVYRKHRVSKDLVSYPDPIPDEFFRVLSFPVFQKEPSRISMDKDFGFALDQKATYLRTISHWNKRDQKIDPYNRDVEYRLVWLETLMYENRIDVLQKTAVRSADDGFYWSEMASEPEPFIRRAAYREIQNQCKEGTIKQSESPWGPVRACVTKRHPIIESVYSIGSGYALLSYEYEFQDDELFRQVRRYEMLGGSW